MTQGGETQVAETETQAAPARGVRRQTPARERVQLRPSDPPELLALVEHQRLKNLAPATIHARVKLLRQLAAWLGEGSSLSAVRRGDLRRFLGRDRGGGQVKRATYFGEVSHLRVAYAALRELGVVAVSPATGLRVERVPSSRQPLRLESVEDVLSSAGTLHLPETPKRVAKTLRDRALLELVFATGMRLSELGAVRLTDVDLQGASVLVRRAKRGESRRLPLTPACVEALKRYLEAARPLLVQISEHAGDGALFVSTHGRGLTASGVHKVVIAAAKRCGVRGYPHVFRRTLATELARAGASLPAIQVLLGHAHLSTTGDYVGISVHDMRPALDLLDSQRPPGHSATKLSGNSTKLQRQLFHAEHVGAA
ncbi:MAG: tyrosine-type recombinase/integrase [Planctomycetota bacterium]